MELFKTDYLSIAHETSDNIIQMNWTTTPSSPEFRKGMGELINAIRETKCGKVVTDTRKLGAISPEDQEWSATEWATEAIKTGYRKLAIVMPEDVFGLMSVEDTMNSVQSDQLVSFGYFRTTDEAKKWLSSN